MKRIKFLFAWYDLWIGIFYDSKPIHIPSDEEIHKQGCIRQKEATDIIPFEFNLINYKQGAKHMRDQIFNKTK